MTLADITGHGREAAGYARRLRGLLAGLEHRGCNQRAWLRRLNHRLCVLFDDEHLCAAIHARMRWVARRSQLLVSVANAGMPAPIVYHAATGTVSQLAFGAPPLGAFSESDRLPQAHLCTLEPGDALVLFSDGLTEARGPDRDFFGDQRIADVVRSLGPANGDVVLRGLSGAVAHFIGDRRMNDDLAMVAVHVPLAQAPFASSIAA